MTTESRSPLVNVERLHRFMDEAGCAAVVARSGKNFTYLAGVAYPDALARHLDFPTPRATCSASGRAPGSRWWSPITPDAR